MLNELPPLNDVTAFTEPGAFAAARAYAPLGGSKHSSARRAKTAAAVSEAVVLDGIELPSADPVEGGTLEQEAGLTDETGEYFGKRENQESKSGLNDEIKEDLSGCGNQETEAAMIERIEDGHTQCADQNIETKLDEEIEENDFHMSGTPPFLRIIENAFSRIGPEDDGSLKFTYDEIRFLVSDPDFNRFYPEEAADMRQILSEIDSS